MFQASRRHYSSNLICQHYLSSQITLYKCLQMSGTLGKQCNWCILFHKCLVCFFFAWNGNMQERNANVNFFCPLLYTISKGAHVYSTFLLLLYSWDMWLVLHRNFKTSLFIFWLGLWPPLNHQHLIKCQISYVWPPPCNYATIDIADFLYQSCHQLISILSINRYIVVALMDTSNFFEASY